MWKEILKGNEVRKTVDLRNTYGCSNDFTVKMLLNNLKRKTDCHYFYYDSPNIKLIKGYKEFDGEIISIAYAVICDKEYYPEAIRIMAIHTKKYLISHDIKTILMNATNNELNEFNKCVAKIGAVKFLKIAKREYEKLGLKFIQDNKSVRVGL